LVTGFKNLIFQGFVTLGEAEAYMIKQGVEKYNYAIKDDAGEHLKKDKWHIVRPQMVGTWGAEILPVGIRLSYQLYLSLTH
jgi:hypothetical protein